MEAVLYTSISAVPAGLLSGIADLASRLPSDPEAWKGTPLLILDREGVAGFACVEPQRDDDRLWIWSIACRPVASEILWEKLGVVARANRLTAIEGAVYRPGWRRLARRYGATVSGERARVEVM